MTCRKVNGKSGVNVKCDEWSTKLMTYSCDCCIQKNTQYTIPFRTYGWRCSGSKEIVLSLSVTRRFLASMRSWEKAEQIKPISASHIVNPIVQKTIYTVQGFSVVYSRVTTMYRFRYTYIMFTNIHTNVRFLYLNCFAMISNCIEMWQIFEKMGESDVTVIFRFRFRLKPQFEYYIFPFISNTGCFHFGSVREFEFWIHFVYRIRTTQPNNNYISKMFDLCKWTESRRMFSNYLCQWISP